MESTGENRTISTKDALTVIITVAVVCLVVVLALQFLINHVASGVVAVMSSLSSLDAAILVALITGCVSVVTVVFGALLNSYLSYRHRRLEFLRDHRERAYQKLVHINYKMLELSREGESDMSDKLLSEFVEFGEELTLWGSTKAIQLWGKWRVLPSKGNIDSKELLFLMEEIMIQLRRDMGQKRGLKKGDLLRLYINDIDSMLK